MGQLRRQGRGHQLVVSGLVLHLQLIFPFLEGNAGAHEGQVHQYVDLVKGHPVAHLSVKPLKDRSAVPQIGVDQLPAPPGAVFLLQMQGHVKMADRHHRLDVMPEHLVDHLLIEGQPLLVGGLLLPGGEDPGPGKGEAAALKAHLRHQPDVLFPVVIHIDGLSGRKIGILRQGPIIQDPLHDRPAVLSPGDHVHGPRAFSPFSITAFTLVRRRSASP